jgi:hypothetical protein
MPVSDTIQSKGMIQPDEPEANFAYWAKMSAWTLWEAATVLVGINPLIGDDESDLRRKLNRSSLKTFQGIYALALRSCQTNEVSYSGTPPQEWLGWAKSRDLPIPPPLEAEVARLQSTEPDTVVDKRDKQLAELKAKSAELARELTTLRTAAGQALGVRERESMLKLIIGMAIKGYGYDPKAKRNDSVRDITNDLEKCDLSLSDDTVRKYLTEGAELVPPKETRGR